MERFIEYICGEWSRYSADRGESFRVTLPCCIITNHVYIILNVCQRNLHFQSWQSTPTTKTTTATINSKAFINRKAYSSHMHNEWSPIIERLIRLIKRGREKQLDMAVTVAYPADHFFLFYLVILVICALVVCDSPIETAHRRFEYKYSFKGPHIVQKDNSIPFWDYGGSKLHWTIGNSV